MNLIFLDKNLIFKYIDLTTIKFYQRQLEDSESQSKTAKERLLLKPSPNI